jgi:hypothetical protein
LSPVARGKIPCRLAPLILFAPPAPLLDSKRAIRVLKSETIGERATQAYRITVAEFHADVHWVTGAQG